MIRFQTAASGLAVFSFLFFALGCSDQRIETPPSSEPGAAVGALDDDKSASEVMAAAQLSDEDVQEAGRHESDRFAKNLEKQNHLSAGAIPERAALPQRLRALGYMDGGAVARHQRHKSGALPDSHLRPFSPPQIFNTEQPLTQISAGIEVAGQGGEQ